MEDRKFRISLRAFLLLFSILLILIPTLSISLYSANKTIDQADNTQRIEMINLLELISNRVETTKQFTEEAVLKDLMVMESKLNELGGLNTDSILVSASDGGVGSSAVGSISLNQQSTDYIEQVLLDLESLTGASYTIFQPFDKGIIRVATSIRKEDGSSAAGTYIAKEAEVYKSVSSGTIFTGRSIVLDEWYSTVYKPFFADDGSLSFVLFAGKPESMYFNSLFEELSEKILGEEGYYYILDSTGTYILSLNNKRNGENIINSVDTDGNYNISIMIETAMNDDDIHIMKYPWMNEHENLERTKIASFTYISQLDWIIGASDYTDRAEAVVRDNLKMQVLIILAAILVGMALSLIITTILSRAFAELQKDMKNVANGDFLADTGKKTIFKDIHNLQETVRAKLVPTLTNLIRHVDDKSAQIVMMSEILEFNINQSLDSVLVVNNSTSEVKSESEKLNELMTTSKKSTKDIVVEILDLKNLVSEQSSSVVEISSSIEETNASLKNVARVVQEKLITAEELAQQGEVGKTFVGNTNKLISGISGDIELLFEINELISTITEQSKLLAMNAAIEAAHAGEKGRGFAVVAGEMRKLANTTAENGVRISDTLNLIQARMSEASNQSIETFSIIGRVTDDILQFSNAFKEIADSTAEISAGTTQILEATNLLSNLTENALAGSNSINDSVMQLSDAVIETASGSENTHEQTVTLTRAMEEVVDAQEEIKSLGYLNASMGTELSDSLEIFRYETLEGEKDSIIEMIRSHQIWVERVERHLNGIESLDSKLLGDHHSCSLGHWLDLNAGTDLSKKAGYDELIKYHENLHRNVFNLVDGNNEELVSSFINIKSLSHKVIKNLLRLILN